MSDESGQERSVTVRERKGRMTVAAFLEAARQEVHDSILRDVSDRTHEQFLWRPNPEMSNIAYLLWHLVS